MLKMEVIPTAHGGLLERHGVLVLPLSLLALSGWFGFRPGQLGRKFVAYFVNFYFILNYILLITVIFLELKRDLDYSKVDTYLKKCRDVIILMYFTLLLYKLFKPYNIVCLINDISNVRKTKLQKGDILLICIFEVILFCAFLLRLHSSISDLEKSFAGDLDYIDKSVTNNLALRKILATVKSIINSTSLLCIGGYSILINVAGIVMRKEFQQLIDHLEDCIRQKQQLPSETFYTTTERFDDLRTIVKKLDDMFSDMTALGIAFAFVYLCGPIYGIVSQHGLSTRWINAIVASVFTLSVLLPSLTTLNSKAHNIVDAFLMCKLKCISDTTATKMNIFLESLNQSPVGLTMCGIFMITKESAFTIVGTFVAYSIIMVQFAADDGSCSCNNSYNIPQIINSTVNKFNESILE